MKKTNSVEIVIQKEVSPFVAKATELVIRNEKDMATGAEMLTSLNQFNDKIIEEKEKITVPAQAVLTAERKRWAPIEKPVKEAIEMIREKMSEYQTEEMKRADEEAKKIADRIAPGKGNLSFEVGQKKLAEVEKPDEKVVVESGSVGFRKTAIAVVVNKSEVPLEYMMVDEKAVLEALQAGEKVGGCVLDFKMVPVNIR